MSTDTTTTAAPTSDEKRQYHLDEIFEARRLYLYHRDWATTQLTQARHPCDGEHPCDPDDCDQDCAGHDCDCAEPDQYRQEAIAEAALAQAAAAMANTHALLLSQM